jgi:hypothetical protein
MAYVLVNNAIWDDVFSDHGQTPKNKERFRGKESRGERESTGSSLRAGQ